MGSDLWGLVLLPPCSIGSLCPLGLAHPPGYRRPPGCCRPLLYCRPLGFRVSVLCPALLGPGLILPAYRLGAALVFDVSVVATGFYSLGQVVPSPMLGPLALDLATPFPGVLPQMVGPGSCPTAATIPLAEFCELSVVRLFCGTMFGYFYLSIVTFICIT